MSAVRPAAGHVSLAVDVVIDGTAESEVIRQQIFQGIAILGFVGGVAGADDVGNGVHW